MTPTQVPKPLSPCQSKPVKQSATRYFGHSQLRKQANDLFSHFEGTAAFVLLVRAAVRHANKEMGKGRMVGTTGTPSSTRNHCCKPPNECHNASAPREEHRRHQTPVLAIINICKDRLTYELQSPSPPQTCSFKHAACIATSAYEAV